MKFKTKYRICLWYSYWGHGVGLTQPVKYFIIFFGISSLGVEALNPIWTLILGIIWMMSCLFIGRAWFRHGWKEAELEVGNLYNKFVKEMRRSHGRKEI